MEQFALGAAVLTVIDMSAELSSDTEVTEFSCIIYVSLNKTDKRCMAQLWRLQGEWDQDHMHSFLKDLQPQKHSGAVPWY